MPPEQVATHITAAETAVETEYRRTKTEAEAFQRFGQEVREISSQQPRFDGGTRIQSPATLRVQPRRSACDRVRNTYRETVLSMPHYEEEYDEPLIEHLSAEFGRELATGLVESTQLTPELKEGLTTASQQAAQQRETFLSQLKAESTELETARNTLTDLARRVEERAVERPRGLAFDELQSKYETLQAAYERCDNLAEARQQSIRATEWDYEEHGRNLTLQSYLYADLDVTYPVLVDLAQCGSYIDWLRKQVEQALIRTC